MTKNRPTVLLIADEPLLQEFVGDFLEPRGYCVETAHPGDDLTRIARSGINLVLLDMGWPETSGLERCLQLRAQPRTEHLPVVALTDFPAESSEVTAFSMGPDEYLTKPFEVDMLLATVARYCSPQH